MLAIACAIRPHACCLVPERREERTTEGGLDVAGRARPAARRGQPQAGRHPRLALHRARSAPRSRRRRGSAPISSSCTPAPIASARSRATGGRRPRLERLAAAARKAAGLGLEVHAGHGLAYDTVGAVAAIPQIVELNIGHFLIGEAIFVGLEGAVQRMRELMDEGRRGSRAAERTRMILGLGNDLIDIRRIEKRSSASATASSARLHRRWSAARPTARRRAREPPTPSASPPRRPAPRRSARAAPGRLLARHGRRESAIGTADDGAHRRRRRAARAHHPDGYAARIDLTLPTIFRWRRRSSSYPGSQ